MDTPPLSKWTDYVMSGRGEELRAFAEKNANAALLNRGQADEAARILGEIGAPLHPDYLKNWDSLLALYHAIFWNNPGERVLDAGAGLESAFLPGLASAGKRPEDLLGCNLEFSCPVVRDRIQ